MQLLMKKLMKKELLELARVSDIALDLHCDSEALLYMFTHSRLTIYVYT